MVDSVVQLQVPFQATLVWMNYVANYVAVNGQSLAGWGWELVLLGFVFTSIGTFYRIWWLRVYGASPIDGWQDW